MISEFVRALLPKLTIILIMALLDMLGGAVIAWKAGIFKWEKVPEFLQGLTGYLFVWIVAELIGFLPIYFAVDLSGSVLETIAGIFTGLSGDGVLVLILLKYGASLLSHVQAILGKNAILTG